MNVKRKISPYLKHGFSISKSILLKNNVHLFNQPKTTTITLLLFLFPLFLWSQSPDTAYQQIFKIENVHYFTIDPLQNLYCLSTDGQLTKYDPTGKALFSYSNTTLGEITFLDAFDPFNILLFYPEQQMLILLDRTLNERSRLDLRTSTIGQAAAVAISFDNNIWIYDSYEDILVMIDEQSNVKIQSDFLGLSLDVNQTASHVFIWRDKVLVNFPEKGIAVFNLSAQLEKWWVFPGILDGQVYKSGFSYYTENGHFIYYPDIDLTHSIDVPLLNDYTMMRNGYYKQYLLNKQGFLIAKKK